MVSEKNNGIPLKIYRRLFQNFGPQGWWPGRTPFEIIVGAILTQNTTWIQVERAIRNLRNAKLLNARRMLKTPPKRIAQLIRPAGTFNVKTLRLYAFLRFFEKHFKTNIRSMRRIPIVRLRKMLLSVNGIGQETADSILLYAVEKPIFVVDAYTRRVFSRHRLIRPDADYEHMQAFFHRNLPANQILYNEYHALIVKVGKDFCKPRAVCRTCPLDSLNKKPGTRYIKAVKSP